MQCLAHSWYPIICILLLFNSSVVKRTGEVVTKQYSTELIPALIELTFSSLISNYLIVSLNSALLRSTGCYEHVF